MNTKLIFIYPEGQSRFQMLFRLFFGATFIALPHAFILFFLHLWAHLYSFLIAFVALFVGRISRSYFDFITDLLLWDYRVRASLLDLYDGYPRFGLKSRCDFIELEFDFQEEVSRAVFFRYFFVYILLIPQTIVVAILSLLTGLTNFISKFMLLFEARNPYSIYKYHARILNLSFNMDTYKYLISAVYPQVLPQPNIKNSQDDDNKIEESKQTNNN